LHFHSCRFNQRLLLVLNGDLSGDQLSGQTAGDVR
jgi:hypothetical protein